VMSLHPTTASAALNIAIARCAIVERCVRLRVFCCMIDESLPQDENRMGQKVMLRLAVMRLSGGRTPWSKFWPATPAAAFPAVAL
jgi:hypothetical protein